LFLSSLSTHNLQRHAPRVFPLPQCQPSCLPPLVDISYEPAIRTPFERVQPEPLRGRLCTFTAYGKRFLVIYSVSYCILPVNLLPRVAKNAKPTTRIVILRTRHCEPLALPLYWKLQCIIPYHTVSYCINWLIYSQATGIQLTVSSAAPSSSSSIQASSSSSNCSHLSWRVGVRLVQIQLESSLTRYIPQPRAGIQHHGQLHAVQRYGGRDEIPPLQEPAESRRPDTVVEVRGRWLMVFKPKNGFLVTEYARVKEVRAQSNILATDLLTNRYHLD
jgi:hypothetical protein